MFGCGFGLNVFYCVCGICQMDNFQVYSVMGFYFVVYLVEIVVNCGIVVSGVKLDGLFFGFIFNFLLVIGMCCQRKQ